MYREKRHGRPWLTLRDQFLKWFCLQIGQPIHDLWLKDNIRFHLSLRDKGLDNKILVFFLHLRSLFVIYGNDLKYLINPKDTKIKGWDQYFLPDRLILLYHL